jgi:hypothetical protein
MRKAAPLFLFLLPVLVSLPCHARLHWLCGLSEEGTQLVCVADIDTANVEVAAVAGAGPAPAAAWVNGTRFPLDERRSYRVNFWSPATDMAHVEQLAQATMCYRSRDCQVTFNPGPWAPRPARSVQALRKTDPGPAVPVQTQAFGMNRPPP